MSELIYIASPYSVIQDISPQRAKIIRGMRYLKVCKLAAKLMKEGHKVFCPIAHSHAIETKGMPGELQSGDFWLEQDFAILQHCTQLWVYMMDGWTKSSGVRREIEFAEKHNIPVAYIEDIKGRRVYKKGEGYKPPLERDWALARAA